MKSKAGPALLVLIEIAKEKLSLKEAKVSFITEEDGSGKGTYLTTAFNFVSAAATDKSVERFWL